MAELFDDIILDGIDAVWTDVRGYESLNALVAAVGTQACNVYIPAPISLDVSLTIPSTYTLHFFNGGCIDILSGVTLTLETRSIHATQPIVTGVGTLAFADGTVVDTRWFASFADAVAQAGDATVTLHVTQPDEVYANITLGDTLTLLWTTPGCTLSINEGYTLSNVGQPLAGDYVILAGDGTVEFKDGVRLKLSWVPYLRIVEAWAGVSTFMLELTRSETINSNITLPVGVSVLCWPGIILTVNAGIVLTILGSVHAYGTFTAGGGAVSMPASSYVGGAFIQLGGAADDVNAGVTRIEPGRIIVGEAAQFESGYDPSAAYDIANAAEGVAFTALEDAAVAYSIADGRIMAYYSIDPPPNPREGDIWIDLDDGRRAWVWVSGAWMDGQDSAIAQAMSRADSAYYLADGKIATFFSSSSIAPEDPADGDIWYQTDLNYVVFWDASVGGWRLMSTGLRVWYGAEEPESPGDGDLWYDSEAGIFKRWDAETGSWQGVGDFTQTIIDRGVVTTGSLIVRDGAGLQKAGITGNTLSLGDTDVRLWAGDTYANRAVAPWRVTQGGSVVANDITIEEGATGLRVVGEDGTLQLTDANMVRRLEDGTVIHYLNRILSGTVAHNATVTFTPGFSEPPAVVLMPISLQTNLGSAARKIEVRPELITADSFKAVVRTLEGNYSETAYTTTITSDNAAAFPPLFETTASVTKQTPAGTGAFTVSLDMLPCAWQQGLEWDDYQGVWSVNWAAYSFTYNIDYKLSSASEWTNLVSSATYTPGGFSAARVSRSHDSPALPTAGVYDVRITMGTRTRVRTGSFWGVSGQTYNGIINSRYTKLASLTSFTQVTTGTAAYVAIGHW